MIRATLPWPPRELSPNARVHWAVKAAKAKAYKADCGFLFMPRMKWLGKATFRITFNPPSRRRQDTDNMLASIKPALDALSVATDIDDSKFIYTLARGEPVKHGAIIVEAVE